MAERRQDIETPFWTKILQILLFFKNQLMDSTNTFQTQLRSIEFLCGLALFDKLSDCVKFEFARKGTKHSLFCGTC